MRTIVNPFRLGTCKKYYIKDGFPVVDVSTNEGGVFVACPVRIFGASLFPVKKGDTVHLYFPSDRVDLPYIIGVDYKKESIEVETAEAGDADYTPDLNDLVLTHAENTVSLSPSGITLDSTRNLRIQLKDGSILRISKEGETEDSPLNGQAFINTLYTLLSNFEAKQDLLFTSLEALATAGSAIPAVGTIFTTFGTALQGKDLYLVPTVSDSKSDAEDDINLNIKLP